MEVGTRTHACFPSNRGTPSGSGALSIPSGLSITLQGHGKDGAGNTTLDLQRQNLGAMLGDTGRMEFSGIHLTNVRCAVARLRTLPRTRAV